MICIFISGRYQGIRDQDGSDVQPLATAVERWNKKRSFNSDCVVVLQVKRFGAIALPCVVESNDTGYPLDSVSWTILMGVNLATRIDWDKDVRVAKATDVMRERGMPPPYWWIRAKQHTCINMQLALGLLLQQKPLSFISVSEAYICYA